MITKIRKTKLKNKTAVLTPRQLMKEVTKSLKRVAKMNFLEQYSVFMGKAQLVEADLKALMVSKKWFTDEQLEHKTLGQVIRILDDKGLRPDFISLLDELLRHRNSIAHDLLVSDVIGKKLVGQEFQRLSQKELNRGLYAVEQVIQVRNFLVKNKYLNFISKAARKKVAALRAENKKQEELWLAGKLPENIKKPKSRD